MEIIMILSKYIRVKIKVHNYTAEVYNHEQEEVSISENHSYTKVYNHGQETILKLYVQIGRKK